MKLLALVLCLAFLPSGMLTAETTPISLRVALLCQPPEGTLKACPEVVTVKPLDKYRLVLESSPRLRCWVLVQEDEGPFEVLAKPGMPTSFDEALGTPSWVFPSRSGWFRPDPQVKRTRFVLFFSPSSIPDLGAWEENSEKPVPSMVVSAVLRKALAAGWALEGQGDYNGSLRDDGKGLVLPKVKVNGLSVLVYELQ